MFFNKEKKIDKAIESIIEWKNLSYKHCNKDYYAEKRDFVLWYFLGTATRICQNENFNDDTFMYTRKLLNNLDFNDAEITEILAKAMAKKWTSEEFEFMFSGGENYEKWKYQDEMFSTTILGYALSTLYDR